ncbi:MAG: hypothetical protein N2663_07930 [Chlorobi bacterium]|nr:hypothetical protein [Chlorobiota bacterium]
MEKTHLTSFWRTVGSVPVFVEHWSELDSTNDRARQLCEQSDCVVLITAQHQRRGRGRHGRAWVDVPGTAVLMTLGIPRSWPESLFPGSVLMAAAALGVLGEVERYAPPEWLRLKYPNDIWAKLPDHPSGKLAGMLLETDYIGSERRGCMIGVGLNVASSPAISNAPYPIRCLAEIAQVNLPSTTELAERILECILGVLVHESAEVAIRRWQKELGLCGRSLALRDSTRRVRVVGYASDGMSLCAEVIGNGERITITNADTLLYDPFEL